MNNGSVPSTMNDEVDTGVITERVKNLREKLEDKIRTDEKFDSETKRKADDAASEIGEIRVFMAEIVGSVKAIKWMMAGAPIVFSAVVWIMLYINKH